MGLHWVSPDGIILWACANFGNERTGRLLSFDGTVADITERKRGEEALRASE